MKGMEQTLDDRTLLSQDAKRLDRRDANNIDRVIQCLLNAILEAPTENWTTSSQSLKGSYAVFPTNTGEVPHQYVRRILICSAPVCNQSCLPGLSALFGWSVGMHWGPKTGIVLRDKEDRPGIYTGCMIRIGISLEKEAHSVSPLSSSFLLQMEQAYTKLFSSSA